MCRPSGSTRNLRNNHAPPPLAGSFYFIVFDCGILRYECCDGGSYSPNADDYFAGLGRDKPAPLVVCGWPFQHVYLISGDMENGTAAAWA